MKVKVYFCKEPDIEIIMKGNKIMSIPNIIRSRRLATADSSDNLRP
jgi:hypothetical protein